MAYDTIILLASIGVQLVTVSLVLRLIPVSRGRLAWVLLASGIGVRAIRHIFRFGLILDGVLTTPSTLDEALNLMTSLLVLGGVWAIKPLFTTFQASERKTRELLKEARALQLAAQSAERSKDEFLAGVSHELRTPLTILIGALDLAEDPTGAPQPQVLKMARDAAGTLRRLIEDLLDSARLGTGRLQFLNEPFSLRECLDQAAGAFRSAAEKKGLTLNLEVSEEMPQYLMGDGERIRQVLRNLLDNAVKFTEKGRIDMLLCGYGSSPDGAVEGLLFQVRDTGCGIPEDKVPLVFKNFFQVDMSPTRLYHGMGLGLGLTQALVEGMGGRVWVEATSPSGTTVSVVLPLVPPDAVPVPPPAKPVLAGQSVNPTEF